MTFWIILSLAIICSYEGVVTQAQPYIVTTTTRTGSRKNTFFLQCQKAETGSFVSNASFYRNGAPSSSDDCLKEYATIFSNGSIHLRMIPSCEGYYQCGHNNILSSPVKVYAYPQLLLNTSRISITLHASEGDDVELPCPMDVSYFDQLNILWTRNIFGEIMQIPESINEDYSVTLSNVTVLSSGVYLCTARSNILSGGSSSLTGPQVNLVVQRKHESPQFLTDISHIQDINNNHIFRINARGTQPLSFKWYLNTKCLNGSVQREISSQDGHIVEIRSQINLPSLPSKTSKLSVKVSNEDGTKEQFVISKTGFLLHYESTPTVSLLPCRNDSPSIESVATEQTMLGEKEQIIIITVLGTISFTLFLLVIFLSCVVCYQRHNGKMCPNCRALQVSESTKHSPDCNSRDSKPTSIFPLPSASGQFPNPISIILLLVGYMYWNDEESDTMTTLLSSLQQILIRVLVKPEVISNDGAMACVKHLRNEIMGFADKWSEQSNHGWFSRQTTISSSSFIDKSSYPIELVDDTEERMKTSSNERIKFQQSKSKGGTKSVNELSKENGNQNMCRKTKERNLFTEPQPVTKDISEDDKDRPTDCHSQQIAKVTSEDSEIEEETDGGAVREVEDTIKTMTNLVCVLERWISLHDNVDEVDQVKT